MSNEGKALVLVPFDTMSPPGEPTGDAPGSPAPIRPARQPEGQVAHQLARITELERRIVELRADLDAARQDTERERSERQAERDRADRITAELAEIARAFAASTTKAATEARTREEILEARIDAARAEMAKLRDRPWWRRVGDLARG